MALGSIEVESSGLFTNMTTSSSENPFWGIFDAFVNNGYDFHLVEWAGNTQTRKWPHIQIGFCGDESPREDGLHPGELRKIATAAYNRSRQSDLQDETIFPASIHREGLTRLSNDDIIYRS